MEPSDIFARRLFLASAAVGLVSAGLLIGAYAPPVRRLADAAQRQWSDAKRHWPAYFGIRPSGHLHPLRAEIVDSVEVHPELSAPGVTLITGLFGDALRARLHDRSGAVIHEWPVDFFDMFPHRKRYKFHALVHGTHLYPNGDLIVIIDGVGMVRVNACGEIIWTKENGAHHSIDVDDEGFIWAPRNGKSVTDPRFDLNKVRVDRISKFDPATGKAILTIDLARTLAEAGIEGIVKGNVMRRHDVLHVNDVEILKRSLAPAFPMFAAGDIMFSSRNTNSIFVLDGSSQRVKWWRVGPMHGQHDPDFQSNGEITMFDNRTAGPADESNDYKGGGPGSRIIALRPQSYDYRVLYASDASNTFYTAFRGKHQMLKNGNVLITESEAGRVFEATPDGRIAWMLVNKYDEKNVGALMTATRYPESYAAIGSDCAAG